MPYDLINSNNGVNRNIKYINRDFSELRTNLIDFAKIYFPNTVTDFSPASPSTMFIEMAAYVGDVMAFYTDNQIQENFTQYARQFNNLYDLAYMMGYKPQVTGVSVVDLDVYQTVPSVYDSTLGQNVPDYRYTLIIPQNTAVNNTIFSTIPFLTQDVVDFSKSSSFDPTTVSVYQIEGDQPKSFLLKKTVKAISAQINTLNLPIGDPVKFETIEISNNNIIGILDITDTEGNEWYEVDYLAQETIFESVKNTNPFSDPNAQSDASQVPYILQLKKVPRRFVSRFINPTTLQLQFGAGTTNDVDEVIIPNPDNVGLGLPSIQSKLTTAFSPSNFLFTKTYGIAPSNTTLTVRYLTGGGLGSNVPARSLTSFASNANIVFTTSNLDSTLAQNTFNSLAVTNLNASSGGNDGDSETDLRYNSLANYAAQLRSVTQEDYLVRALSMPSLYGSIAKAYIEPTKLENLLPGEIPSSLDLYILAFDQNKNLTLATPTLKQNLSTYLSQYRIINDSIRIRDAFIINIGVDFEILVLPNFNSNEVLTQCINELITYFNVNNSQINQVIFLNELYSLLNGVKGVQNVKNISITNKVGESLGYSKYAYDIKGATSNNVVYPSQDPSIFEVKFPNSDIKGKVVSI
jgi:hypothetical protein